MMYNDTVCMQLDLYNIYLILGKIKLIKGYKHQIKHFYNILNSDILNQCSLRH